MIRLRLDYTPRDWQQECHRRLLRFSVLALHRRAGKTELAIMELLDKALQFDKDPGSFLRRALPEAGEGDRLGAPEAEDRAIAPA